MKIDKKIKSMPWPGPYRGTNKRINFRMTVAQPVVNGRRLLVVTVSRNLSREIERWMAEATGEDFRLVCCKAEGAMDVAYITERGKGAARKSLGDAVRGWHTSAACAYPEISEKDEAALCRWLGVKPAERTGYNYNHAMTQLDAWTIKAITEAAKREALARGELRDEDVDLCPEELPAGLIDYIHRVVLPEDDVLLYKKGNVRGTCYLCGHTVRTDQEHRFIQGGRATCPNCGRRVRCFMETSESFATDTVENVATIQLGTDSATLFVRQWRLLRPSDPAKLRDNTAGCLKEVARYAVRGNRVAKWQREAKEACYMRAYRYDIGGWARVKNVSEVYDGSYYFYIPQNWAEILATTSMKYMNMAEYDTPRRRDGRRGTNMIRFLMDWARYPTIELLWKAGYTQLVDERVTNQLTKETRNTIRWSKGSLQAAFPFPLRLLRAKKPKEWEMEDVQKVENLWDRVARGLATEQDIPLLVNCPAKLVEIDAALHYAKPRQVVKYITRQQALLDEDYVRRKEEAKRNHQSAYIRHERAGETYRDYLAECLKLHLNMKDKQVLFPADLKAAHQRTITMVKYEASKKKEAAYQQAVQKLERLAWEKDGLLIRPAATVRELIAEGEALHHCVGGYADRVAKGETAIFLIRRVEEPEKPFYTLELREGQVIQCRTAYNKGYEQDRRVVDFVQGWLAKVILRSRKKNKKKEAHAA